MSTKEMLDAVRSDLLMEGHINKDMDDYIRGLIDYKIQEAFDNFDVREAMHRPWRDDDD